MKILIVFLCMLVYSILVTALKTIGIMLGGIPTLLLLIAAGALAKLLCKCWDNHVKKSNAKRSEKVLKYAINNKYPSQIIDTDNNIIFSRAFPIDELPTEFTDYVANDNILYIQQHTQHGKITHDLITRKTFIKLAKREQNKKPSQPPVQNNDRDIPLLDLDELAFMSDDEARQKQLEYSEKMYNYVKTRLNSEKRRVRFWNLCKNHKTEIILTSLVSFFAIISIICAYNAYEEQAYVSNDEQTITSIKDTDTVYVTKTGIKYHKIGCSALRKTKRSVTVAEAEAEGYEPCQTCFNLKENKKINRIIPDDEARKIKVDLISEDGKNFGEVSLSARDAVGGNYLDKYTPVDDNEKKILDEYKEYMNISSARVQSEETSKDKATSKPAELVHNNVEYKTYYSTYSTEQPTCDYPTCDNYPSNGGYYCSRHECLEVGCHNPKANDFCSYCYMHKCAVSDCRSGKSYNSDYCSLHKRRR